MIGIPPKDGDDTEEFGVDSEGVAQSENGVETPRMDLENETESPGSIQSPEAKRQKARDERQEEFNKKIAGFFDEFGCFVYAMLL